MDNLNKRYTVDTVCDITKDINSCLNKHLFTWDDFLKSSVSKDLSLMFGPSLEDPRLIECSYNKGDTLVRISGISISIYASTHIHPFLLISSGTSSINIGVGE